MTRELAKIMLLAIPVCAAIVLGFVLFGREPIKPTPQVGSLVTVLRGISGLDRLENEPFSCWLQTTGYPARKHCRYRAADTEVHVVWYSKSERLRTVVVSRPEPKAAEPFAWIHLASVFSLLCADIPEARAASEATALTVNLKRAPWRTWDGQEWIAGGPDVKDAMRVAKLKYNDDCSVELVQRVEKGAVRAQLRAHPFQPKLPTATARP